MQEKVMEFFYRLGLLTRFRPCENGNNSFRDSPWIVAASRSRRRVLWAGLAEDSVRSISISSTVSTVYLRRRSLSKLLLASIWMTRGISSESVCCNAERCFLSRNRVRVSRVRNRKIFVFGWFLVAESLVLIYELRERIPTRRELLISSNISCFLMSTQIDLKMILTRLSGNWGIFIFAIQSSNPAYLDGFFWGGILRSRYNRATETCTNTDRRNPRELSKLPNSSGSIRYYHINLSILSSNFARDNRLTIYSIGSHTTKFSHSKLVEIVSLRSQDEVPDAPSCLSGVHKFLVGSILRLKSNSVKALVPWANRVSEGPIIAACCLKTIVQV